MTNIQKNLIMIIVALQSLSSCTLKLHYYLVNKTDESVQFRIFYNDKPFVGIHEFKATSEAPNNLNRKSFTKFEEVVAASTDNGNDFTINGELPSNSVMYLGFGMGAERIFDKIILETQSEIDTVNYEKLNKTGRVVSYKIE